LKPTITFGLEISPYGEVMNFNIRETIFKNLRKLSYEQFDIIEKEDDNEMGYKFRKLAELANLLLELRRNKGALAIYDLVKGIYTNEEGIIVPWQKDFAHISHIVIQELMILTNKTIAQFFAEKDIPFVYRNHTVRQNAPNRGDILEQINTAILNPQYLETLRQRSSIWFNRATYGTTVSGHYGLNEAVYAHVTSPLRRFADFLNHYIIKSYIHKTEPPFDLKMLNTLSSHINMVVQANRDEKDEYFKKLELNKSYNQLKLISESEYYEMEDLKFADILKAAVTYDDLNDYMKNALNLRFENSKLDSKMLYILLFKAKKDSVLWYEFKKKSMAYLVDSVGMALQLLNIAHQKFLLKTFTMNAYKAEDGYRADGMIERKEFKVEVFGEVGFKRKKDAIHDTCLKLMSQMHQIKPALEYVEGQDENIKDVGETNDEIIEPVTTTEPIVIDDMAKSLEKLKKHFSSEEKDTIEAGKPTEKKDTNSINSWAFDKDVNYVSKIMELSMKYKECSTPEFEYELSGLDHQPEVSCTCKFSIGERLIEKISKSSNKKSAKQHAAYLVWMETNILRIGFEERRKDHLEINNFVGLLLELCVRKKFSIPSYNYESMGSVHKPVFECTLKMFYEGEYLSFKEFGPTKKLSKQNVSEKCYNYLQTKIVPDNIISSSS
jgi:hypothetical protein